MKSASAEAMVSVVNTKYFVLLKGLVASHTSAVAMTLSLIPPTLGHRGA